MRNIISLAALLLTFVGSSVKPVESQQPTSSPSLTTGQCMNDYYGLSNPNNLCGTNNFNFLGVVTEATVVYDNAAQDKCNCDCNAAGPSAITDASCPACSGAANEISCEFEGEYWIKDTIIGACLGDDDNVQVGITADFSTNELADIGIYVATDGGELFYFQGLMFVLTKIITSLPALFLTGTAISGTCAFNLLDPTHPLVEEFETPADSCPDIRAGTLSNFVFPTITLPCTDSDGDSYLE